MLLVISLGTDHGPKIIAGKKTIGYVRCPMQICMNKDSVLSVKDTATNVSVILIFIQATNTVRR